MKTFFKFLAVAAVAALGGAAYADDLEPVQIQNAHGQTSTLFRPTEPTSVALFVGGRGIASRVTESENPEATAAVKQNPHGQTTVQFEPASTR